MADIDMVPDCTKCAALCCIALAFDKSDQFAFDKPAGVACSNLAPDHTCTIHADLAEKGFGGCVRFDCLGAGQRVTQEVFKGQSWRDNPEIANPMFEAFRAMRDVHELLLLLEAAIGLNLPAGPKARLSDFKLRLTPVAGWDAEGLDVFMRSGLKAEIMTFLKSLSEIVKLEGHRG